MTLPALITPDTPAAAAPDALQHEIAKLEKLRTQIFSDMESLRTQESNLRAYETRLREARPQPGPVAAGAAPGGSEELAAAWEKFNRAHALLEAERRSLTDERMSCREQAATLKQREDELKRREHWLAQREAALQAAQADRTPPTGMIRIGLDAVPFADLFRSHRRSA
jgi:chromosome segregation ATPase